MAAATDVGGWRRLPTYARRGITAGTILLALTAAIGALHTPWARPLLARLGGCPAMRVSATQANDLRMRGVGGIRGALPAPLRPALGFALDRTTEADVQAWAARAGVSCAEKKHGLVSLHCAGVPRAALPEAIGKRGGDAVAATVGEPAVIGDLALTFGPQGHLVSVDAFTRGLPPAGAAAAFTSSDARLGALLGPPTDRAGDGDLAALARAPLATSRHRYRFRDYVAIVSVTNLPTGLAVREQYLSAT